MIGDFFYVIRMFVVAILVALTLQVKIGEKTLDENFSHWLKTSIFVDYLQTAVDGGIAITRDGYKKTHLSISGMLAKINRHRPNGSERGMNFTLKRYNDKDDPADYESEENSAPKAQGRNRSPQ